MKYDLPLRANRRMIVALQWGAAGRMGPLVSPSPSAGVISHGHGKSQSRELN